MLCTGFRYLKVGHFNETFFICQNSIKQRNSYLRTHLANGCLESIVIKHRRSQSSELCLLVLRSWVQLLEEELAGLFSAAGVQATSLSLLQNRCWGCFLLCTFFCKSKNPVWIFFWLLKIGTQRRPYIKSKWHNMSFQKAGDTCVNTSNRGEFCLL